MKFFENASVMRSSASFSCKVLSQKSSLLPLKRTMYVVTNDAKLENTVSLRAGGRERLFSLEHRVTIQAQLVLDHSVCNLLGHLFLWHLVGGQILGSEAGAVDRGGELILSGRIEVESFEDVIGIDLAVVANAGKVDHDCGVVQVCYWRKKNSRSEQEVVREKRS